MIRVEGLKKSYDGTVVIDGLDLVIGKGEKTAILAPSGCGKTTLLRLLAGFEKPDAGRVTVDGKAAFLFQEVRLFPDFDVLENVAAVLDGKDAKKNAAAWLVRVGLSGAEHKYPDELSGGMAQRAALARALALDRPILYMDEPFKGLDAGSKSALYALVKEVCAEKTLLLVTHDEEEARILCQRILRFGPGMLPSGE